MKRLVVAILFLAACGSGTSAPTSLSATGAWARTTPTAATNGVVYLTLVSPVEDAVVAAAAPAAVATTAELHETMGGGGAAMPNMPNMDTGDGQMTMQPVDEIPVAKGGSVTFEPGGKHIMLTGLAAPLKAGDHFTLTLTMKSGATLPVDVTVADNAP